MDNIICKSVRGGYITREKLEYIKSNPERLKKHISRLEDFRNSWCEEYTEAYNSRNNELCELAIEIIKQTDKEIRLYL